MTTTESAGAADDPPGRLGRHQRVDDGVEVGPGGGVLEDQRGQRGPVEAPVGVEDLRTEPLDDRRQSRAGPGSTTSRAMASASITIAPAPGQRPGHGRFPRSDPTAQSDTKHAERS